ncbi:shikimate kinase [Flavobacterium sp. SM2513]|uniref:shikimate kinase n=1 Tax=Flavobacterium sp. SM2513 TaxID=3424766 RepID=UPI003D7FDF25
MKKILVLGYMGSGKSVIGKMIAERLHFPFFDLDQVIENRLQLSISEIFLKKGEIYFRKIEHEIFNELILNEESFVLSLGGGTPCYANNHLLLSGQNTASVYLNASIDTLFSRLFLERKNRPLIANLTDAEFKEFIAKHLFDRSYFYNQALLKILVNDKTKEEIATEIINRLA